MQNPTQPCDCCDLGLDALDALKAQAALNTILGERIRQQSEQIGRLESRLDAMSDRYFELYQYVWKIETGRRLQAIVTPDAGDESPPSVSDLEGI